MNYGKTKINKGDTQKEQKENTPAQTNTNTKQQQTNGKPNTNK